LITGLLSEPRTPLLTTLGGLLVGALLTYLVQSRLKLFTLNTEYRYEQRKALRSAIGEHHGRILEACRLFHQRMQNLYLGSNTDWLRIEGDYSNDPYYFLSTLWRFLAVMASCYQFERAAIFVDQRIAERSALDFVQYVETIIRCGSDPDLFAALPYDSSTAHDHFFRDQLLGFAEVCAPEGTIIPFSAVASLWTLRLSES
jgi:hypothetical protein